MSGQVLTSIRLVIGAPSEQRMELVPRKSAISTEGRFVFTDDTHTSDDVIQNDALPNIDSSPIHLPELNKIIETVVTTDKREANKVINAYRLRAKLFFGMKNYDGCIADATCIIERRAFDSNAYVIRSQAFLFAKRFYEAYEDVLRACILEKFAEAALNDLLMKMVKQIEISPAENHPEKSFVAFKKSYKFPTSQWAEMVWLWKATDNYILVNYPQPFDEPHPTGFRLAVNALYRNDYSLIVPACEMEIKANGELANVSNLLRAQMHLLLLPADNASKRFLIADLRVLKDVLIALDDSDDQHLLFELNVIVSRIRFALMEDKSSSNKLYAVTADNPSRKRRAIAKFWQGYDLCATFESMEMLEGMDLLRRSTEMLGPKFFAGQLYYTIFLLASQEFVHSTAANARTEWLKPTHKYISRLGKLHSQFPKEIQPVKMLINYYIQTKAYKLVDLYVRTLSDLRRESSDADAVASSSATHKHGTQVAIDFLKSMIRDDAEEYAAYDSLIDIYLQQTHEYAKCLEVFTKALAEIRDRRLYRRLFERRQQLIRRIAAANFWSEL